MEANQIPQPLKNVQPKDYLIVRNKLDKSLSFVQVAPVDTTAAFHISYKHIDDHTYPITDADVDLIANFGQSFRVGKVYNIPCCRPFGSKETQLGKLWFFYKPNTNEEIQFVIDALNELAKELIDLRIFKYFENIVWEAHTKKTSFMPNAEGFYRRYKLRTLEEKAKKVHVIGLIVESLTPETIKHVLWHECFHALFKFFKSRQEEYSAWINYFASYHKRLKIYKDRQKDLLKKYLESADAMKMFVNSLDQNTSEDADKDYINDDQELFKLILKNIKQTYGISASEIEILKNVGRIDLIEDMWPEDPINISAVRSNGVSIYSLKNIEECFCEVMAYYVDKSAKLPKDAEVLAKNTLKSLIGFDPK